MDSRTTHEITPFQALGNVVPNRLIIVDGLAPFFTPGRGWIMSAVDELMSWTDWRINLPEGTLQNAPRIVFVDPERTHQDIYGPDSLFTAAWSPYFVPGDAELTIEYVDRAMTMQHLQHWPEHTEGVPPWTIRFWLREFFEIHPDDSRAWIRIIDHEFGNNTTPNWWNGKDLKRKPLAERFADGDTTIPVWEGHDGESDVREVYIIGPNTSGRPSKLGVRAFTIPRANVAGHLV